jgi:hypothetical protein
MNETTLPIPRDVNGDTTHARLLKSTAPVSLGLLVKTADPILKEIRALKQRLDHEQSAHGSGSRTRRHYTRNQFTSHNAECGCLAPRSARPATIGVARGSAMTTTDSVDESAAWGCGDTTAAAISHSSEVTGARALALICRFPEA